MRKRAVTATTSAIERQPGEAVKEEDVYAKVANWSKLHSVQREYERRVRQARAESGNGPEAQRLEAEMKKLIVKVDAAFKEASEAVHGTHRPDARPAAS
jgi:hypothetical protein